MELLTRLHLQLWLFAEAFLGWLGLSLCLFDLFFILHEPSVAVFALLHRHADRRLQQFFLFPLVQASQVAWVLSAVHRKESSGMFRQFLVGLHSIVDWWAVSAV